MRRTPILITTRLLSLLLRVCFPCGSVHGHNRIRIGGWDSAHCDEASWHFLPWNSVKSVFWCVVIGTVLRWAATMPSEGTMANLTGVVRQLQKERQRVQGEMERLNAALAALGSLGGAGGKPPGIRAPRARKPMSVAARKRIAAAQRARWAKWKKNKRNK
jgi:hypothetical protein